MAQWLRNGVIYPELVGSIPPVDTSQNPLSFHCFRCNSTRRSLVAAETTKLPLKHHRGGEKFVKLKQTNALCSNR